MLEFGSIKDAEFIGVAVQNGREIVLELKNQGDMPIFLNGTIRIQNEDNGEVLTGIHFSKRLSGYYQTQVKYHVAVAVGNYAAIINGRYADGKKTSCGNLDFSQIDEVYFFARISFHF